MSIVESKESIKRRLQAEAARQWGVDENDLKNGSFDPLVDLLFGAFAIETEKLWQEMEVSRSRVVKRMVETVLPEVVTGIVPAHSVLMARPVLAASDIQPTDQFVAPGNEGVCFSPAGRFGLSGAKVGYIATGARIDKLGSTCQREPLIRLMGGKGIPAHTAWIAVEPSPAGLGDQLVLFLNWEALADRAKYLSYTPSVRYYHGSDGSLTAKPMPVQSSMGIRPVRSEVSQPRTPLEEYEYRVREFYYPQFVTLDTLSLSGRQALKRYPDAWEPLLEAAEKALFQEELVWIKMEFPAPVTPEALERLLVVTNCFPVLNRRLIRQRGKLQPMFNVYALTDEAGFLGIHTVWNGDGEELRPVSEKAPSKADNVYSLRLRNIARFDQRDAFEKLNDVTAHLRDDLAAFNALDNSIVNTHLDTINKGIGKLREHLDKQEVALPRIYLLVYTKSEGTKVDIHFWTSLGSKANGMAPQTKLNAEPTNEIKTEGAVLLLPTSGGQDPLDESQMRRAFRQTILTRGKAVTVEDFRTIAADQLGSLVSTVRVNKGLSLGEGTGEGVRRTMEVLLVPDPGQRHPEEFWLRQAQLVKNALEQRSTGVLPLFVSVEGYSWKV